jgi:hypothetical protein
MPKIRFDRGTQLKDYDLELEVLRAVTPWPGYQWPASVIAEVCGISPQMVRWMERRALAKLRVRLRFDTEMAGFFKSGGAM